MTMKINFKVPENLISQRGLIKLIRTLEEGASFHTLDDYCKPHAHNKLEHDGE